MGLTRTAIRELQRLATLIKVDVFEDLLCPYNGTIINGCLRTERRGCLFSKHLVELLCSEECSVYSSKSGILLKHDTMARDDSDDDDGRRITRRRGACRLCREKKVRCKLHRVLLARRA